MTRLQLLSAVNDSDVSPGVLGFVVVALLGVATVLLIRSMNRQIRRIDLPDEHRQPPPEDAADDAVQDGTARPDREPEDPRGS